MEASILATLTYADIFDYPLTEDEIWEWLITNQFPISNFQFPIKKNDFEKALNQLPQKKLIGVRNGCYFLSGREKIVETREQRERWSQGKIERAEKVVGILRLIPWIKLIGITGGLARKSADENDDIDLFFITAQNRLWLTRGLIVFILRVLGLYRRPNKIKNMICPNMLVSEDHLKMGPEDLFTAHEVCLMKPLFERDETYQKLLVANLWVKKFLPNIYRRLTRIKDADQHRISVDQSKNQRQSVVEYLARDLQLWYMRDRRTTEIVSENLIKFHPEDIRLLTLKKYQEKLKNLLTPFSFLQT